MPTLAEACPSPPVMANHLPSAFHQYLLLCSLRIKCDVLSLKARTDWYLLSQPWNQTLIPRLLSQHCWVMHSQFTRAIVCMKQLLTIAVVHWEGIIQLPTLQDCSEDKAQPYKPHQAPWRKGRTNMCFYADPLFSIAGTTEARLWQNVNASTCSAHSSVSSWLSLQIPHITFIITIFKDRAFHHLVTLQHCYYAPPSEKSIYFTPEKSQTWTSTGA